MTHSLINYLSPRVKNLLPRFVRQYGPALIDFLEAYLEFLEEEGNPIDVNTNSLNYHDIDHTLDRFVDYFHNEFMPSIPYDVLVDRRLLIKHIREFYRTKGSEKSYKFLFRILYNEDVDFYYPGRDILRTSHGKWYIEKRLITTNNIDQDTMLALIGNLVTGQSSMARARVENAKTYISAGSEFIELTLSNVVGTFISSEEIIDEDDNIVGVSNSYTVLPGHWLNQDGFISNSTKKLQGRDYYQEYSYVLKTGQSINVWGDVVRKLVHPAGTKMFGEVLITSIFPLSVVPEGALENIEFAIEAISANVAPTFLTELGYQSTDSDQNYMLEFDIDPPFDVETQTYLWAQLSGTAYVATSQNLSGYPGAANLALLAP
jgi:hypothetical protein